MKQILFTNLLIYFSISIFGQSYFVKKGERFHGFDIGIVAQIKQANTEINLGAQIGVGGPRFEMNLAYARGDMGLGAEILLLRMSKVSPFGFSAIGIANFPISSYNAKTAFHPGFSAYYNIWSYDERTALVLSGSSIFSETSILSFGLTFNAKLTKDWVPITFTRSFSKDFKSWSFSIGYHILSTKIKKENRPAIINSYE